MIYFLFQSQIKQAEAEVKRKDKREKPFIPPKEPTISETKSAPKPDSKIDVNAFKAKIKQSQVILKALDCQYECIQIKHQSVSCSPL